MTTIGLIHYGSAAFVPLLVEWLDRYRRSGCWLPVVVFADLTVPIPSEFKPFVEDSGEWFQYIRFDPTEYPRVLRPGKAFDAKGSIIIQAIQRVLGPLLIVDTDAFFVRDPKKLIDDLPDVRVLMGEDPITRYIGGVYDGDAAIRERNAGVLYFCEDDAYGRASIAAQYIHTFLELREANNNPMLEQCTWTMLARNHSTSMLPKALNWSYLWGRDDPETCILHEHGPQKWNRLEGASRNEVDVLNPVYAAAYK